MHSFDRLRLSTKTSDSGFTGRYKKELDGKYTMILLCWSVLWRLAGCAQWSVFDGDISPP